MAGFLYRELRLSWYKIILFMCGMMIYPVLIALLMRNSPDMEGISGNISALVSGVGAVMAFLVGGTFEVTMFKDDERRKWAYYTASTPDGIKRQIGAKYIVTLFFAMATVTMLTLVNSFAYDGNHDIAIATSLYMVLFYVQLFMRSLEYPLIVRFGGKMGNVVKMVLIAAVVLGGAVYLLFGDLSPFADMSSFWDRLFEALEDSEAAGKIALGTGIAVVGITVLYYLSYRLSVKWYLKGVDHYAK